LKTRLDHLADKAKYQSSMIQALHFCEINIRTWKYL